MGFFRNHFLKTNQHNSLNPMWSNKNRQGVFGNKTTCHHQSDPSFIFFFFFTTWQQHHVQRPWFFKTCFDGLALFWMGVFYPFSCKIWGDGIWWFVTVDGWIWWFVTVKATECFLFYLANPQHTIETISCRKVKGRSSWCDHSNHVTCSDLLPDVEAAQLKDCTVDFCAYKKQTFDALQQFPVAFGGRKAQWKKGPLDFIGTASIWSNWISPALEHDFPWKGTHEPRSQPAKKRNTSKCQIPTVLSFMFSWVNSKTKSIHTILIEQNLRSEDGEELN